MQGIISIKEIENFISDNIYLEKGLGTEKYIELLTFDYGDKNAENRLQDYLFINVVNEGEFETWKLKVLLHSFLNNPNKVDKYLDNFYNLYCGGFDRKNELKKGYKFLGNLGLNYSYWLDETYLRTSYGDNWKFEYDKSIKDFGFYHEQLKPIALQILNALNNEDIKIVKRGEYSKTEELQNLLEADNIFSLKHPKRKFGS